MSISCIIFLCSLTDIFQLKDVCSCFYKSIMIELFSFIAKLCIQNFQLLHTVYKKITLKVSGFFVFLVFCMSFVITLKNYMSLKAI